MNTLGYIDAPSTRANINLAIEHCQPHLRPVLEMVRDDGIGLLFVGQGPDAFRLPGDPRRPAFIILGDDFDRADGPGGFHLPSIRRAIRSCVSFVVVSSAPLASIYGTAAATVALTRKNVMLVETRPEQEVAWAALIQKIAPGSPLLLSTIKGGTA